MGGSKFHCDKLQRQ